MEGESNERVFLSFSPDDFTFAPSRAVWQQPCWISIYNGFRAVTERAKAELPLPLTFDFKIDAFARKPHDEQLGAQFWRLYDHVEKIGAHQWSSFLIDRRPEFYRPLGQTAELFKPPWQFVPRQAFRKATLDLVLAADPETMAIYIPEDTNSDGGEIYTLRIHSSLWHHCAGSTYLFYEKTLPWRLHPEDVLPWFHATVKKLPKKRQPRDLTRWDEKLIEAEPDLAPPLPTPDAAWADKPTLVLVFGTTDEVGYAALYHLKRNRIQRLTRHGSEITIRASIESRYEVDPEKLWWTFHLLTPTARHAERLESRLLSGSQIHFGLGDDIAGMVAIHQSGVDAIDVPTDDLQRLCGRDGVKLELISSPRYRHKSYTYC